MSTCPICTSPVPAPNQNASWCGFDCPRCGRWSIGVDSAIVAREFEQRLGDLNGRGAHQRSRLSYLLRRQQHDLAPGRWVPLPWNYVEAWHLDEPLASPSEQLDQLVIWIGDHQSSPAESASLQIPEMSAWVGATITPRSPGAGLGWLLEQEQTAALIESRGEENSRRLLRLTMAGWLRYQALKRGQVEGRRVLMAMQFDDAELDSVVRDCFVPAVHRAGFELRTIADKQPAGLIDDQLRVALRTSRFVIADLTHGNKGAYWEAGFAEDLEGPSSIRAVKRSGSNAHHTSTRITL
jgi:hypothetical protein